MNPQLPMNKFALTGGIGAGKSYVSNLLAAEGFPIFNCDKVAKQLMQTDTTLQENLQQLIGRPVILDNGLLDKQAIGQYLFSSETHQKAVNALIHPRVRKAFTQWTLQVTPYYIKDTPWVGMECALLFESKFDSLVDFTISVSAPESLRIERVMQRDGLTEEAVRQRIGKQIPEEWKRTHSDFVFHNNYHADLSSQIKELKDALTSFADNHPH